jgi:hypothetical protein
MHLEHPHTLGRDEAVRRLERVFADLATRSLPAGVELQDVQRNWSGGRMDFSLKARKGFFGTTIGGTLNVTDDAVIVDATLPPMITSFLGEDRIRERMSLELARLLG